LEQLENALKHSDYERLIFTERASQDGSFGKRHMGHGKKPIFHVMTIMLLGYGWFSSMVWTIGGLKQRKSRLQTFTNHKVDPSSKSR